MEIFISSKINLQDRQKRSISLMLCMRSVSATLDTSPTLLIIYQAHNDQSYLVLWRISKYTESLTLKLNVHKATASAKNDIARLFRKVLHQAKYA